MGTQPISVQLTDSVAPSIAPNLKAIAVEARGADASLRSLKISLDLLNNSGASGLATQLRGINQTTNLLANSTQKMGNNALKASINIDILTTSYVGLNQILQRNIALLQTSGAIINTTSLAAGRFAGTQRAVGAASHGQVSDIIAASAAIRGLEGNFGTSVRAGERFLVTTLGLGPALRLAFPVFGALALLGILDILGQHVGHLIEAFGRLKGSITDAETQAIISGDKIIKAKSSFFSADNFARLLEGAPSGPKIVEVDNARYFLKQLQYTRELRDAQAEVNEKGLQGLALQKQKVIDIKAEIGFAESAKANAKLIVQAYQDQLKAVDTFTKTITDPVTGQSVSINETARKISDPGQIKAIQEQLKVAVEAVDTFSHELDLLKVKQDGAYKTEPLAAYKDQLKAARAQLKLFDDELGKLKQTAGHVLQPSEIIGLLNQQKKVALPQNVPELDQRLGSATQQLDRQKNALEAIQDKYRNQAADIGLYNDALKEKNILDKIDVELLRNNIQLTRAQRDELVDLVKFTVENKDYQQALNHVYTEFNDPADKFKANIAAINKLLYDGAISQDFADRSLAQAARAYKDAVDPLNEYEHSLQNQVLLLGKYGAELQAATEVQRIQEQLLNRRLTLKNPQALTDYLLQLNKELDIRREVNSIGEASINGNRQLEIIQTALNRAYDKGFITLQQYRTELAKLKVEQADLRIELGTATSKDVLTSVFGDYIKQFKGFAKEITGLYKGIFAGIADGFANAVGRAIAFGESFGDAIRNVAQTALAELISGFIKLGIQWVILHFLGESLAATTVATTVANATAVAAAWAPGAALASLATLGTNAGPADLALGSTVALADTLAFVKFARGGLVPGFGSTDTVPSILTPGEFVLTKAATQMIGSQNLTALNNAAKYSQSSSTAPKGIGGNLSVQVIHDGSTGIQVEQVDENRVRIIARQEAKGAVEQHSPAVIAADLQNPNSKTSKAVASNHIAPRRR